uniref:Uncharacterized protein n=1 Tax=Leersia perrieri TaxID=77586 RepID=A0A0D9WQX1_9ORYZ
MANVMRQNKEDCIMGSHGCEPFLSPGNLFIVGFNDLFDLFNLDKLDPETSKKNGYEGWIARSQSRQRDYPPKL